MSLAANHEPYRMPAGILALAVHAAFFAFMYFGLSWQTQPAATMSVELWDSLPETRVARSVPPKVEPKVEPKIEPKVEPVKPVDKPDIVMPDKKAPPEKKKVVEKTQPKQPSAEELAAEREQAEQAERAAATGRVVDEYIGKITSKIRSRTVMPPGVADDAVALFAVTVLPGGSVLNPRLLKSSGNAAYDNAVERAIIKAQPLPLPSDPGLFNRFRELRLRFRPKE